MPTWAKLVAPYAEGLARNVTRLAKGGLGMIAPIGPAPRMDRSRVRVRVRPIASSAAPKAKPSVPIATTSNSCRSRGARLTVRKRLFCEQCLPDRRQEMQGASGKAFQAAGPAKIAELRTSAKDPTQTGEAQARRRATASAQRQAILAWRDDGSLDRVDFKRDILPKLQSLSVRAIAEAMGSSISHASKVRSGAGEDLRLDDSGRAAKLYL